jgi:predicted transcriptional regulator
LSFHQNRCWGLIVFHSDVLFKGQEESKEDEVMKRIKAKDIMTTDVLVASAEWSLERLTEFFVENASKESPI